MLSRCGVSILDKDSLTALLQHYTLNNPHNCDVLSFVNEGKKDEDVHVTIDDVPKIHEAINLMKDHEYETACKLLKTVAQGAGFSVELEEKIAVCHMNTQCFTEAIDKLKQIVANSPRRYQSYMLLSRVYTMIGTLEL